MMPNPKMIQQSIEFTEETNALDYLEHACLFIQNAAVRPTEWKWAVIALHGALYGYAICACQTTDSKNLKTKERKLIAFDEALKRCEDASWMQASYNSKNLTLSAEQKEAIDILKNDLRNNFQHFRPMSWVIKIRGMPQVAMSILEVIRFLALETGHSFHLNESEKSRIRILISETIAYLQTMLLE